MLYTINVTGYFTCSPSITMSYRYYYALSHIIITITHLQRISKGNCSELNFAERLAHCSFISTFHSIRFVSLHASRRRRRIDKRTKSLNRLNNNYERRDRANLRNLLSSLTQHIAEKHCHIRKQAARQVLNRTDRVRNGTARLRKVSYDAWDEQPAPPTFVTRAGNLSRPQSAGSRSSEQQNVAGSRCFRSGGKRSSEKSGRVNGLAFTSIASIFRRSRAFVTLKQEIFHRPGEI